MTPLCANRDCSAFLDRGGVPHVDVKGAVVLLCPACADFVERTKDYQYARIEDPNQPKE